MKLTNAFTIVSLLLVLNLPLAAKSEPLGQDIMSCPFKAISVLEVKEITVIHSRQDLTRLLGPVLLESRTALVTFWDTQLIAGKNLDTEALALAVRGNLTGFTDIGAIKISSNSQLTKVVD